MKRLLTVALGVALCTLGTAAANARPSEFPTAHDNYSTYRDVDGDGDYRRPRSRRHANTRHRRRHVARTYRRAAVRSGRRVAVRRGRPAPMGQRSFTRYAQPGVSRGCLTSAARALLGRIESQFGPMQIISTCRPGARIAGTGRISRHASGNAVDFNAGGRKAAVVRWLIANHRSGGTMTYAGMSHIHVDIGPHFVSLNSGGSRYR
jgi:hypothetical protein